MSDWRDQFTEPRTGFVKIVTGTREPDEYRFLSDFGYVLLSGEPKSLATSDGIKRLKAFAKAEWESGKDHPFRWDGEL